MHDGPLVHLDDGFRYRRRIVYPFSAFESRLFHVGTDLGQCDGCRISARCDVPAEYLTGKFPSLSESKGMQIPRRTASPSRMISVISVRPGRDKPTTPEQTKIAETMKSVKAAWDKAPAGPGKDAALKHYQAAEKVHTANKEAGRNRTKDPGEMIC